MQSSTLCKLCTTKQCWNVLCASCVVQSSAGKCFVQALLNFAEMRKADHCSDEMKTVELTLMTCEKRWDAMRRAEMR